MNNKPWKIDKESVHFKILKSWLSLDLQKYYLREIAPPLILSGEDLSEEDLLIRLIEVIRKIVWRVFKILENREIEFKRKGPDGQVKILKTKKIDKKIEIPYIIITDNIHELAFIYFVIECKKRNNPDFFCDRDKVIKEFKKEYALAGVKDYFQTQGGIISLGAAAKIGIALYGGLIISLGFRLSLLSAIDKVGGREEMLLNKLKDRTFHDVYNKFNKDTDLVLKVIAEEAFHYACKHAKIFEEPEEIPREKESPQVKEVNQIDDLKRRIIIHCQRGIEYEENLGIPEIVNKLFKILKQEEKELLTV